MGVFITRRRTRGLLLAAALLAAAGLGRAADGDLVVKLPAAVEDVAVADSGRLLVLKLQGEKGLTVYDTIKRQQKKIELPTADFSFGAGGDTAVVFLKKSSELQSWNLKTFAMTKAKEFADPVNILQIVMGHSRGDLAFLRVAHGNAPPGAQITTSQILDVVPLSIRRPKNEQDDIGTGNRPSPWATDLSRHRANGDMSLITEWTNGQFPSGIGVYYASGDRFRYAYSHNSAGYLASGDDGKVYSGSGAIFDAPTSLTADPTANGPRISRQSALPGLGGLFFLGLANDGGLNLYQAGQTEPLCAAGAFPEWPAPKPPMPPADGKETKPAVPPATGFGPSGPLGLPWRDADPRVPPGMREEVVPSALTLDKRVVFAPSLGYTIFLPYTNDRLIQRKFDLKADLDLTKNDYFLVQSSPPPRAEGGSRWQYQVVTLAKHGPVKFELTKAPEGMTLSPEGLLTWKIPGGVQGKGRVEMTITDGKNNVLRHDFDVTFE